MAHEATTWAYRQQVPGPAKFVLVAMSDMADEEFTCFPSIDRLAWMTGFSEKTVRRAVKVLEDAGLVVSERRHRSNGTRTSNRYRLAVDASGRSDRWEPPVGETSSPPVGESASGGDYRSESPNLPVRESQPTGQSDRAIVNPQGNYQGRGAREARTPPPPFCPKHMPNGPEGRSCRACADAKAARKAWQLDAVFAPPPHAIDWATVEHEHRWTVLGDCARPGCTARQEDVA